MVAGRVIYVPRFSNAFGDDSLPEALRSSTRALDTQTLVTQRAYSGDVIKRMLVGKRPGEGEEHVFHMWHEYLDVLIVYYRIMSIEMMRRSFKDTQISTPNAGALARPAWFEDDKISKAHRQLLYKHARCHALRYDDASLLLWYQERGFETEDGIPNEHFCVCQSAV